ncbi:hypothetical protein Ndes2526B_g00496 [Nannochloris sp. 'desiccata']
MPVTREGRLVVGLVWITALDALAWSEKVLFKRLALAQVISFCMLVLLWAAKGVFFVETGPTLEHGAGPQQGAQSAELHAASKEQNQLLADKYRAILHAAINEIIARQDEARIRRRTLIEAAVEKSGSFQTADGWSRQQNTAKQEFCNELAFGCTYKGGELPFNRRIKFD